MIHISYLAYVNDVNLLCGSLHTKKKNTESLVVATKETSTADKNKYMVRSIYQNAERSNNIKINSRAFERAEEFKYLKTTLKNQIMFKNKLRAE